MILWFTLIVHQVPAVLPPRNDSPDPTPRVRDIPCIPRYDMDMQVHDGLAGCRPDVDTNIVAIGVKAVVEKPLCLVDDLKDCHLLFPGSFEIIRKMPFRDD